jgi:hypothetical protein
MSHVDDVHLLPAHDLYEVLDELCQDVVKPFPTLQEDKLQNSCSNKGDVQLIGLGPGNQQIDHILGDIEELDQRKDVEKRGPRAVVDFGWQWRQLAVFLFSKSPGILPPALSRIGPIP